MDMYREIILDHYKHPRNFGTLAKPDASAQEYNATCGDRIRMEVRISKGNIKDIKFSGVGCAISQASASMLTEKVKRMDTNAVMKLATEDMLALLETTLTPSRIKCAVLPLEVLQKALKT
ncbi:SUF system NifU family Fe-S cluster assembly protein [Candidatus Gottesmanbacteria bacterium]|nr:SUF system NifU family Fe-S cluster assembly protein [Candidatus Gottesmanbacteria bacterium]